MFVLAEICLELVRGLSACHLLVADLNLPQVSHDSIYLLNFTVVISDSIIRTFFIFNKLQTSYFLVLSPYPTIIKTSLL